MRRFSHFHKGFGWPWLAILLLSMMSMMPLVGRAQDDGGEQKPKKEKAEKPAKEKKEKPAKEVKEKPVKEKKEKPAKEKTAKAKDDAAEEDLDDGGGDEEPKSKKKKKKKGQEEDEANSIPLDSAQLARKNKPVDRSGAKHGNPAPCARYRRGTMEFIDLNDVYITIKRKRHREIHYNGNRGIRATKTRKISRDQKIDKSKTKVKLDKEGKLKDKGNKVVYKLKWLADCEYNLIFKRSKKPTRFQKGWVMNCKIVTCYEDYYDCDCDMHDIMQYASVRKQMTKSEKARKDRMEAEAVAAFEANKKKEEEESIKAAELEAINKAREDEVFGPIKRIQSGNINESKRDDDEAVKPGPAEKTANPTPKPDATPKPEKEAKPEKENKPEKEEKEEKSDKAPKEKQEKAPKEKKEKVPKEKKEKAPKEKKEKAPKEKKEKVPKEKAEKAPKEKKEKAPKEDE